MTASAWKRGVSVYTPEAFWQQRGLDVARSARRFLARFKALAPSYVRDRDPVGAGQRLKRTRYLSDMYDFCKKLLLDRGRLGRRKLGRSTLRHGNLGRDHQSRSGRRVGLWASGTQ